MKKENQKKTHKGLGSVFYSDNRKSYVGQYSVDLDNNQKRRLTVYGKTKSEVTVNELGQEILDEQFALNEICNSTYYRKLDTLKSLCPLTDIRVQDVEEKDLKQFFISKINYSQSYLNKVYQLLASIFREALKRKYIITNPMAEVTSGEQSQRIDG